MKKLILILVVVGLFVSCNNGLDTPLDSNTESSLLPDAPVSLSDSRFNGSFTYFYYWQDSYGIEEDSEYTSIDFDGTNKAWYYTRYKRYSTITGWSHSGDYIGDSYSWYLEFEINNGMYRTKLWKNDYSEWDNWENYSFSEDGNTLTLYNHYNIEGNDLVLTKDSDRSINSQSRSISNTQSIIKRRHYTK